MTRKKRLIYLLIGPFIFALTTQLFSNVLTTPGAQSIGVGLWMIFWWITRPVHITVTAIMPVVANALLNIAPMETIISQYSSESIILIFGSTLISLPWATCGLDRRVALKALCLIGPSMKSQITVWFLASVILSTVLPNVAVCALFTPIAVAMLAAAGHDDIPSSAAAVPILLAIGWGVSLGGAGTPMGGAMNVVAISYLEEFTGHEFMYIDWVIRMVPYFIIATIVLLGCMLMMPIKVKTLDGTKEYFKKSHSELGPMKRDEKICATLFILALIGAFARPLYADLIPGLAPAYVYLTLGSACFFITATDKGFLLTWETVQKGMMWGMMILFAGGMALGKLMNGSGGIARVAELVSGLNLDGGLSTIVVIVVVTRLITEVTNATTAAAIVIPIVFALTSELGLNPVPYWFITAMAYNEEFILPLSVRAIPVSYGLDANDMLKLGIPITIITSIVVIIVGYACMQLWPAFSELTYL